MLSLYLVAFDGFNYLCSFISVVEAIYILFLNICCSSKDPSIPLNYTVHLLNHGDRRKASGYLTQFEALVESLRASGREVDQEVSA